MPPLGRKTGKLLKVVDNKPHATGADHDDVSPTPPATNSARSSDSLATRRPQDEDEDFTREPQSSEDEFAPPPPCDGAQDERPKPLTLMTAPGIVPSPQRRTARFTKSPSIQSPESTRSKRSDESDEQASSDGDIFMTSSQCSTRNKRLKPMTNIHAKSRLKPGYGKHAKKQRTAQASQQKKEKKDEKATEQPTGPKFQLAPEVDIFQFKRDATFQAPDADAGARGPLSPLLSSLSSAPDSPDVEEVLELQLPESQPYNPKIECTICGAEVDQFLKDDFENEFTGSKSMSFKWQQRFCRYHKQKVADEFRKTQDWPEVDWKGLEERMKRFERHLRDVIYNRVPSKWKDDLRCNMRPSQSKSKEKREAADSKVINPAAWTGYYGPRGGKVMADHIIDNLSDDLRERASKDKVVAASGVRGGVSGFVQAVLVPELACQLIAEDMKIPIEETRAMVGFSSVVGELLHPDLDDKVTADTAVDDMDETEM